MRWYKVNSRRAHQGAGTYRDTSNYVYARDAVDALKRAKRIPGIKRNGSVPGVNPINDKEAEELESEIRRRLNLDWIKKTWYFGIRNR